MTLSELGTLVTIILGVGGVLVTAGRYVVKNAMRDHVSPKLEGIAEGFGRMASSNEALADRLHETNAALQEHQSETREILLNHHGRISALEAVADTPVMPSVPQVPRPTRRKKAS